jgi:hypothetical protein
MIGFGLHKLSRKVAKYAKRAWRNFAFFASLREMPYPLSRIKAATTK